MLSQSINNSYHIKKSMSQNNENPRHTEVVEQYPLIFTPYKHYETFINYWSLINSEQLWFKLHKYLSMKKKTSIKVILQNFSEIFESNPVQEIECIWSVMWLLTLLIRIWIKLKAGKKISKRSAPLRSQANLDIFIDISTKNQKSVLEIQIQFLKNRDNNERIANLEERIHHYCNRFELVLEEGSSDFQDFMLKSKKKLFLDGIELPSTLTFSSKKYKNFKLIFPPASEKHIDYLDFWRYFKLLDYFSSKNIEKQTTCSLVSCVEEYCKQLQQNLKIRSDQLKYYLSITPMHIFVEDKKITPFFSISKDAKSYIGRAFDQMAKEDKESVYTLQQPDCDQQQYDKWSAGLTLLCIISRSENQTIFQRRLAKAKKKSLSEFVDQEMLRIVDERQFDSEVVLQTLKNWLQVKKVHQELPRKEVTLGKIDWIADYIKKKNQKIQILNLGNILIEMEKIKNQQVQSGQKKQQIEMNTFNKQKSSNSSSDNENNWLRNEAELKTLKYQIEEQQRSLKNSQQTDPIESENNKSKDVKCKNCGKLSIYVSKVGAKNHLFYCSSCNSYICFKCHDIFHGEMPCQQFNDKKKKVELQRHLQTQLLEFTKKKKQNYVNNPYSLSSLFERMKIEKKLFEQLQALMKACFSSNWANCQNTNSKFLGSTQSDFIGDVSEALKQTLYQFLNNIRGLGQLKTKELQQLAKNMKNIGQSMKTFKNYQKVILYRCCKF